MFGTPSTRRNQLGLTHLSFVVEDVDVAARELEQYGGRIVGELALIDASSRSAARQRDRLKAFLGDS